MASTQYTSSDMSANAQAFEPQQKQLQWGKQPISISAVDDIVTDGPGSANDSYSVSASHGGSKETNRSQPSASEEFCETPISPYYSLF